MKVVDLHTHTIFSDGNLTPQEVVKLAKLNGISAISITDHDEIAGISEATKIGKKLGIDIIPGVELSAKRENKSIHLLGYFIDIHNQTLLNFLQEMKQARLVRAEKIVLKFKEYNIHITLDDIKEHSGLGGIGRPHIAETLVDKGLVKDFREVFSKYLGDGKPCYVSKSNMPTRSTIELILNTGGIPVLAHPGLLNRDEWIPDFVNEGLLGIETWYPSHSKAQIKKYLKIAEEYKLIPTGGSDSHGTRPGYTQIGDFTVPYKVLERLKESAKSTGIERVPHINYVRDKR